MYDWKKKDSKKLRGQWQNEIKVAQYRIRTKFKDLSRINSCTVQLQVSAEHLSFPKSTPPPPPPSPPLPSPFPALSLGAERNFMWVK